MVTECESRSDYEVLITEEYFPFWDEETQRVWADGLKSFTELCGCDPDADVEDHDILCQLLLDRGLALRQPLSGADLNLFLGLDEGLKARSLCWCSDYFIATPQVTREILTALASERCKGAER